MEGQIRVLDAKWKVAEGKLAKLKTASADAWHDLRGDVDRALADLKARLRESRR
jgi:hypothetical protein